MAHHVLLEDWVSDRKHSGFQKAMMPGFTQQSFEASDKSFRVSDK
jgi:hypothetical protein